MYPLSPSQVGMWMQSMAENGSGLFIEQAAWCLEGILHRGALERAWQSVVDRHAALRSAILAKGREPVQAVLRHIPVNIREGQARREDEDTALIALMESERQSGFRLNRPPLIRFALLRTEPERAWWILTFHHIILDGWSLPILWSEAAEAYAAAVAGTPLNQSLPPDYRNFAAWLKLKSHAEAEVFWRAHLAGFSTPNRIASSFLPEPGRGPAELETRMTTSAGDALNTVARDCSVSPAIVIEALWAILLAGRTKTTDVVFGATVSGRAPEVPGIERMVGFFINTIPVRLRFDPETTLREFIASHHRRRAAQAEFDYCSAGQIRGWSEVAPGHPLYQSLMVYENLPGSHNGDPAGTPSPHLRVTDQRLHGGRTTTPLTLLISPGAAPHLRVIYHPGCIPTLGARALAQDLERLVTGSPEWLDRPVQEYCETVTPLAPASMDLTPVASTRPPFVAPRNRLEHQLARIWEELFDRTSIGVLDDFFSLGGHSLLVLRMAAIVRNQLNLELPLHTLVVASTIEKLALALAGTSPEDGSLVSLASGGDGAPIYCVHPLGGHVLCYAALAKTLRGIHPCWGMQAKGLHPAEEPAASWEEIINHHWALLPPESIADPLVLVGYSYGGYIAMELAMRAQLHGRKRISVILLDVPHPSAIPEHLLLPDRATLLHSLFGHILGLDLATLREMQPEDMLSHVLNLAIAQHILPPDSSLDRLDRLLRVAEAHSRCQPPTRRYAFSVCLLRARDGADRISSLPDLGWREYTSGVTLQWVKGSHETMMEPQNIQEVADCTLAYLGSAISTVDRNGSTSEASGSPPHLECAGPTPMSRR
jgi:thioesterase domain-containing protein